MATGPTYNKFSSIAIGGPNTNTINSAPYGNTSFDVSGNAIVRNNLTVLGTLTYSGSSLTFTDLLVPGNTDIGGYLGVTGPASLYDSLLVGGTGTFNGPVGINNTLTANTANFVGPVGITGTTNLYGTLNGSSANFSGNLGVTGSTQLTTLVTSGNTNINGTLGVTGNTQLTNLTASGNTNINGTLGVTGNTQLTNLTTSGNTNINGTLGVTGKSSFYNQVDFYNPTDATKDLKIGYDINEIIRVTNVTGQTSAVTSGVAFKPVTFTVPKNNIYDTLNFSIPLNLFSGRAPITGSTGTWTLTYSSVTMNVYKNSVLQSSTGTSITPVGFTSGTAKTGTQISSSGAQNIYMWAYWGYFDCNIPIERFNTSTNTYEIELIVTGTATHSAYGSLTLWVASIGGYMGYGLLTNPVTFTQTRLNSPSGTAPVTWLPSTPTYTTPYYSVVSPDATIMSRSSLNLAAQQGFNVTSNNSIKYSSLAGYFTAESANNFYYNSFNTSCDNIYQINGSQVFDFNVSQTQNTITSNNIPLLLDTGTQQLRLLGNTLVLDSGTSIAATAGTTIDFTAGTNNDLTLTTSGTGNTNLVSANNINLTATNGIKMNSKIQPNYSYSGLTQTYVGYFGTANNTNAISNGGAWTALINSEDILGAGVKLTKGIWQAEFVCGFVYSTTSHYRNLSMSVTGATTPDASRTTQYAQNSSTLVLQYMITSIFVIDNTSSTIYCMGQLPTTGGTVTGPINRLRITKIG